VTVAVERAQPSIVLNGQLRPGGPFSRRTPSIHLTLPEQLIAFLDGPSAAHRPSIYLLWFEDCPNHAAARQMLIELVPIHAPGAVVPSSTRPTRPWQPATGFPGASFVQIPDAPCRCSAEKNGG